MERKIRRLALLALSLCIAGAEASAQFADRADRNGAAVQEMAPPDRGGGGGPDLGREEAPSPSEMAPDDSDEGPDFIIKEQKIPPQPTPLDNPRQRQANPGAGFNLQNLFGPRHVVTCQTPQGYCRFRYRRAVAPGEACRCGELSGRTR
ncbi:hypothetical protein [Roseitranquillus sediminis]|uniref:hypothetical protein n=1 Tax=Roseitranquillus sediminis TaxID=2809051 RepID=UPI001D0C5F53|nr:hypothetical protein [Roseitranquillus sediminis]MBM9594999.1 hypothetical protein [Roseitranquillus sediminis]